MTRFQKLGTVILAAAPPPVPLITYKKWETGVPFSGCNETFQKARSTKERERHFFSDFSQRLTDFKYAGCGVPVENKAASRFTLSASGILSAMLVEPCVTNLRPSCPGARFRDQEKESR